MMLDRWSKILSYLSQEKEAKVNTIADEMDVSIATIRRDIKQLSKRKLISCKNGVVTLIQTESFLNEDLFLVREGTNSSEKHNIAKFAASLVKDGDIIYLDAGTTTLKMIEFLYSKKITVVTNNALAITRLREAGIKTYVCSGYITPGSGAIYDYTTNSLSDKNIMKSFLGVNSIDENGYYVNNTSDFINKKEILSRCKQVFILADSTKYYKNALLNFASLKDVTLICDKLPPFQSDVNCLLANK